MSHFDGNLILIASQISPGWQETIWPFQQAAFLQNNSFLGKPLSLPECDRASAPTSQVVSPN